MKGNWPFTLREALTGIRRGFFHSLVVVGSIAVAVTLLGLYHYGKIALQNTAASLLQRSQFEAFIALSIADDQHGDVLQRVQALDPRWRITYISRSEAAAQFAREFDSTLFSILQENPLPASLRLTLPLPSLQPDSARRIADRIKVVEGIEEVVYDQALLQLLQTSRRRLAQWGLILGSLAVLVALGLTYNAVRLKIDQQREAVQLMSLLGATPVTLHGLFWIQGALLGGLGGGLGALLLGAFFLVLQTRLPGSFDVDTPQLGLILITGLVLGFLGSLIAVGRFLKV